MWWTQICPCYAADFRAGERTFSLITQVVGRAGGGEKTGRAVIQTYTPENDVIRFAARQDYEHFYEQEIQLRRPAREPPFRDLFVLTASGRGGGGGAAGQRPLRQALEGALGQLDQECSCWGPPRRRWPRSTTATATG